MGTGSSSDCGFIGTIFDTTTNTLVGLQTPLGPLYFGLGIAPPSTDTLIKSPFSNGAFLNNVELTCTSSNGNQNLVFIDTTGKTFSFICGNDSSGIGCNIGTSYTGTPPSSTAVMQTFSISSTDVVPFGTVISIEQSNCSWLSQTPDIRIITSTQPFNGLYLNLSSGVNGVCVGNVVTPLTSTISTAGSVIDTSTSDGVFLPITSISYTVNSGSPTITDTFYLNNSTTEYITTFHTSPFQSNATSTSTTVNTTQSTITFPIQTNPYVLVTISSGGNSFMWGAPEFLLGNTFGDNININTQSTSTGTGAGQGTNTGTGTSTSDSSSSSLDIVLVLALVAALGAGLFFYLSNKKKTNSTSQTSDKESHGN